MCDPSFSLPPNDTLFTNIPAAEKIPTVSWRDEVWGFEPELPKDVSPYPTLSPGPLNNSDHPRIPTEEPQIPVETDTPVDFSVQDIDPDDSLAVPLPSPYGSQMGVATTDSLPTNVPTSVPISTPEETEDLEPTPGIVKGEEEPPPEPVEKPEPNVKTDPLSHLHFPFFNPTVPNQTIVPPTNCSSSPFMFPFSVSHVFAVSGALIGIFLLILALASTDKCTEHCSPCALEDPRPTPEAQPAQQSAQVNPASHPSSLHRSPASSNLHSSDSSSDSGPIRFSADRNAPFSRGSSPVPVRSQTPMKVVAQIHSDPSSHASPPVGTVPPPPPPPPPNHQSGNLGRSFKPQPSVPQEEAKKCTAPTSIRNQNFRQPSADEIRNARHALKPVIAPKPSLVPDPEFFVRAKNASDNPGVPVDRRLSIRQKLASKVRKTLSLNRRGPFTLHDILAKSRLAKGLSIESESASNASSENGGWSDSEC